MDEWGFESGEELKVLEKKSGKRSSLPRFALPALLIAAGLLVVLALLWSAPLARETTAFRNRTAQDGLTYSYTIDQGVATACGVLAVGPDGRITAADTNGIVSPEADGCAFSGKLPDDADRTQLRAWAVIGGELLIEAAPEAQRAGNDVVVRQFAGDGGSIILAISYELDGLDPNMVYLGGFLLGGEGEEKQNISAAEMIFSQTSATLTALVAMPGSRAGEQLQCMGFYYPLNGADFVLSSPINVTLLSPETLETPPAVLAPTPTATPTSTPAVTPTSTPAPVITRKAAISTTAPTASPSPTAEPALATEPSSRQFSLYPSSLRYYYGQLTRREKQLFSLLYDGISSFEEKISAVGYDFTTEEYKRVHDVLIYDCPELIQLQVEGSSSYSTNVQTGLFAAYMPVYSLEQEKFESIYKDLLDSLAGLALRSDFGLTDYEHELSIYRYLIEYNDYSMEVERSAFADNALLGGEVKCAGYARGFVLACRYYGIDSCTIWGNTMENGIVSPTGHMWCCVMLDGAWYACDPTWDDSTWENVDEAQVSILKNLSLQYLQYFNLTDSQMNIGRIIDEELEERWTLPVCNSTRYDFYQISCPEGMVRGDWKTEYRKRLDKMAAQGDGSFAMRFENRSDYENAVILLPQVTEEWLKTQSGGFSSAWYKNPQAMLIVVYRYGSD